MNETFKFISENTSFDVRNYFIYNKDDKDITYQYDKIVLKDPVVNNSTDIWTYIQMKFVVPNMSIDGSNIPLKIGWVGYDKSQFLRKPPVDGIAFDINEVYGASQIFRKSHNNQNTDGSIYGTASTKSWLTTGGSNGRIRYDFNEYVDIAEIHIINYHDAGSMTELGVKDAKLYLTNVLPNNSYGVYDAEDVLVYDGIITQHTSVDNGDTFVIKINDVIKKKRYFYLDAGLNWNAGSGNMGLRHIYFIQKDITSNNGVPIFEYRPQGITNAGTITAPLDLTGNIGLFNYIMDEGNFTPLPNMILTSAINTFQKKIKFHANNKTKEFGYDFASLGRQESINDDGLPYENYSFYNFMIGGRLPEADTTSTFSVELIHPDKAVPPPGGGVYEYLLSDTLLTIHKNLIADYNNISLGVTEMELYIPNSSFAEDLINITNTTKTIDDNLIEINNNISTSAIKIDNIIPNLTIFENSINNINLDVSVFYNNSNSFINVSNDSYNNFNLFSNTVTETTSIVADMNSNMSNLSNILDTMNSITSSMNDTITEINGNIATFAEVTQNVATNVATINNIIIQTIENITSVSNDYVPISENLALLNNRIEIVQDKTSSYVNNIVNLINIMNDTSNIIDYINATVINIEDTVNIISNSTTDVSTIINVISNKSQNINTLNNTTEYIINQIQQNVDIINLTYCYNSDNIENVNILFTNINNDISSYISFPNMLTDTSNYINTSLESLNIVYENTNTNLFNLNNNLQYTYNKLDEISANVSTINLAQITSEIDILGNSVYNLQNDVIEQIEIISNISITLNIVQDIIADFTSGTTIADLYNRSVLANNDLNIIDGVYPTFLDISSDIHIRLDDMHNDLNEIETNHNKAVKDATTDINITIDFLDNFASLVLQ